MGLWDKIKQLTLSQPPEPAPQRDVHVPPMLGADDPGNPFGVPILSLMQNLQLTSFSENPDEAARAVSWRAGQHDRFAWELAGQQVDCELEFQIEEPLPDGLLFIPEAMEDKWVIAWKQGRIAAARSWSGETVLVADTWGEPGTVKVHRLTLAASAAPFSELGDPVSTFQWLIVSHALAMRVPFPASPDGLELLRGSPVLAMSIFGHRLFCASSDYALPAHAGPLRSDGELVDAIAAADIARIEALLNGGHRLTTPSRWAGYRPIHMAVALKNPELVGLLLARGADPNQDADDGRKPLALAIVVGSDDTQLQQLVKAGADLEGGDSKGFRPLHAAAEANKPAAVRFLRAYNVDLEARTANDLTAFHIACALGNLEAVKELARVGANTKAPSQLGTPLEIATQEQKDAVVEWLARRA